MNQEIQTVEAPAHNHGYLPQSPELEEEALRRLMPVVQPKRFELHLPEEPSMAPPPIQRHTPEKF
jgi:hypothetical protein